jgi:hypothetical protein
MQPRHTKSGDGQSGTREPRETPGLTESRSRSRSGPRGWRRSGRSASFRCSRMNSWVVTFYYSAQLRTGDHGDVFSAVDTPDPTDHGIGALGLWLGVGLGTRLGIAVAPDQKNTEKAGFAVEADGACTGVSSTAHAPRRDPGDETKSFPSSPTQTVFRQGAVGNAEVDQVTDGRKDGRQWAGCHGVGVVVGGVRRRHCSGSQVTALASTLASN